jgi:transketolase
VAVLTKEWANFLQSKALQLRIDSIRATSAAESGHPTSCLSAADIISVLFFHTLQLDIHNPYSVQNDRFILSKGHAIPVVYAAWKQLGVLSDEQLMSLRKFDSILEGHPTPRFSYNEAATGSLGQGLSIGVGMALASRIDGITNRVFVMMGDGEIAEGSVWEAAELASVENLEHLVGIVDCNRLGQSGASLHDHKVEMIAKKFEAFGWHTCVIDGHDLEAIAQALDAVKNKTGKPTLIVAKTFKGHGLDDIENKNGYHGKPFKADEVDAVIAQLRAKYDAAANYKQPDDWSPIRQIALDSTESENIIVPTLSFAEEKNRALFGMGKTISTRKAFGYALASLGLQNKQVVALDADVKNSTFSEMFEEVASDRFIQCFIAEQNMVGVSVGLQARGKIPFSSTFGAFFSRAFDQIRMAGIGRNALRLCGSHCGVSIGQDGPSQMALEDIAMMRTVPGSVVLYPSDGVSTFKLVEQMAGYNDGISYLRTTRADTPMLYDINELFPIGGCKVIRQSDNDQVCIIAAGITLHEALKAYTLLEQHGIAISVVDLYSIKPLDKQTVIATAQKSQGRILTVEDHYEQGGIGEAVAAELADSSFAIRSLAVGEISRSGTPEELLAYAGIDAAAIVKTVLSWVQGV